MPRPRLDPCRLGRAPAELGCPGAKGGDDGLTVHFDERAGVHWTIDPATGNAARSAPRTSAKELETCGICHSRSAKVAEGWRPGRQLLETHVPALLQPGLFEADGKMVDEVYDYASFRQSKMFTRGVSCSDCHDPHSLELRAEGNGVCYQCHDQAKYGAIAHHHHAEGSPAAGCPACHMPERTYMVVDPRHDHGFRIPRPDLSARFGVSNSCNDCHADEDAAWAAAAIERWHGPDRKGFQTWTETLAAARDDTAEAGAAVAAARDRRRRAPAIVRATALEDLARYPSREALGAAQQRHGRCRPAGQAGGAAHAALAAGRAELAARASGLLDDPVRGVRLEAASLLAAMPQDRIAPADRERLARALEEYVAAQRLNADRPEARVNLGNLYAQQGQAARPRPSIWRPARSIPISCRPTSCSPSSMRGRAAMPRASGSCAKRLRACPRSPSCTWRSASTWCGRVGAPKPCRSSHAPSEIDPDNARYAYVHGIALNSTGRTDEALEVLEASQARHPADRDTLLALVTINRDAGRFAAALSWADRLVAVDPQARTLRDEIARLAGEQQ